MNKFNTIFKLLFFKGRKHEFHFYQKLLLLFFVISLPFLGFSQTNVQWKTTIKGGGHDFYADWLFDVLTTSDGNYLGVGFAKEDEVYGTHDDVPAYCLVGANGVFIRDGLLDSENQGRLYSVTEPTGDSYFAGGSYKINGTEMAILVKINKASLDPIHFEIGPLGYKSRAREVSSIIYGPGNALEHILVAGNVSENNGSTSQRWVAIYDQNGNLIAEEIFDPINSTLPNDEWAAGIDADVDNNGNIIIYTASYQVKSVDGGGVFGGGPRRSDSDILMSSIFYNVATGQFDVTQNKSYNSIQQSERIPWGQCDSCEEYEECIEPNQCETTEGCQNCVTISDPNPTILPGDIFYFSPPLVVDEYPYGPKYIGTNFERIFDNFNEPMPENGFYIEDWSDGSEDRPYSLVITEEKIVVSALLNQLNMWGNSWNNGLGRDTEGGLHTGDYSSCSNYNSSVYYWGEAYVLFFDKATLNLTKATHLGTWTGGDFQPNMRRTKDGGFVVAGTIAGCPEGLPAVGEGEHGIAVKLNAAGDIEYRTSSSAPRDASFCAFAVTEAVDGGIVLVGNSEEEFIIDGQEREEEDFCFVKFGNNCSYENASITAVEGQVYTVALNEEWTEDKTVNTQIVVPAGHKLSIKGTSQTPLNIQFADSREVYDVGNTNSIGIKVEVGGKLSIRYAVLSGWSCDNQETMWDGISIEGIETQEQINDIQGECTLLYADIVNARIGVAATSVWWKTHTTIDENEYPGTGSNASFEIPSIRHGGKGGGLITAFYSDFINNKRSVIFMRYKSHNKSQFNYCNFISNDLLADLNQRKQTVPNNYNSSIGVGTQIHLSSWATNVRLKNCNFTGFSPVIPDFRPLGITGWDASFSVVKGSMNTLKIGIECSGTIGGITANLYATDIAFNDNFQGINLRSSTADIIRNCIFNDIPETITLSGIRPSGIFGEYNAAALIENNQFFGASSDLNSYGLILRGTSEQGTEVKENDFSNTRYGNQFEGNNAGLITSCNTYTDIGDKAWTCLELAGQGVLHDQGYPGILAIKTGNQFVDNCVSNSGNKHIYSDFAFNYYDSGANLFPANISCVSNIVNFDAGINSLNETECASDDPPCPEPCDYINIFLQSDQTIKDRNKVLRALIHTGDDVNGEKLPALYDDALFILKNRAQTEDIQLLLGSLTALERFDEAQLILDNLVSFDLQVNNYTNFITDFTNTMSGSPNLPVLLPIGQNNGFMAENTPTLAMIKNAQWLQDEIYTPLVALDFTEAGGGRKSLGKPDNEEERKFNTTGVFPNPFVDFINFDTKTLQKEAVYQLKIIDILGQQIWEQNILGGDTFKWNTIHLSKGTYFYSISLDKANVSSGKIIKLN